VSPAPRRGRGRPGRAPSREIGLCGLGVFAVSLALPLLAQAPPGDAEAEVRRLGAQVEEIAGKQQGLLDRLELLKRRVRLAESTLAQVRERREEHVAAVAQTRQRLAELKAQDAATRRYLLGRMRQSYSLGLLQDYRVYFAAGSTQDLREAALYLGALARRDRVALARCADSIREQERVEAELARDEGELSRAEAQVHAEREGLVSQQTQLSRALLQVTREKESSRKALDEILAAARSMDRYLKDLSFKNRVDLYAKDMAAERGKLPPPVDGRAAIGFGDYVHPRFRTRVPHPGIDFDAPLGSPVRAVFDGTVAYAGWLSGYGYTVIVSHPGGFFTVYGRLDEVRAAAGDLVSQGEPVGSAGGDVNRGATGLYFELRAGDRAVDPAPWLAPARPRRGAGKGTP